MSEEHSPAPWTLEVGDHSHRYVLVTDSNDLTVFYKYGSGSAKEAGIDEANARLTAAGPDLLAALKAISEHVAFGDRDLYFEDSLLRAANAAIAKASQVKP